MSQLTDWAPTGSASYYNQNKRDTLVKEEITALILVKKLVSLHYERMHLTDKLGSYPPYMNVTKEILQKELEEVQLKICNHDYAETLRELIIAGDKL